MKYYSHFLFYFSNLKSVETYSKLVGHTVMVIRLDLAHTL